MFIKRIYSWNKKLISRFGTYKKLCILINSKYQYEKMFFKKKKSELAKRGSIIENIGKSKVGHSDNYVRFLLKCQELLLLLSLN